MLIYISKTVAKVLSFCAGSAAPVLPHHASSELLSIKANNATDDEAVSQHECRSLSNEVPARSKPSPTLQVEPICNHNQFFQHDFAQSNTAASIQDFEIIFKRSTCSPNCLLYHH